MKARGNTKIILQKVEDIQRLVGKALMRIDNPTQFEIRSILDEAHDICVQIRDMYDPIE